MEPRQPPEFMTVPEVADFLRVRERTIYTLVRTQRIPCCKLSGKLLFPKQLIELWIVQSADYPQDALRLGPPPPIITGSHDPLLEWAARESNCDLALLVVGSSVGLHQLLGGQATACGLHMPDPVTGSYDPARLMKSLPGIDFVVIEWARRQQGLIVAAGNPAKIASIGDLRSAGVRVVTRQEGSGSAQLFAKLVADAGLSMEALNLVGRPFSSETDIAVAVRNGVGDAGLAIEAAARDQGLGYVPLEWERFDLVVRRVEFFEPGMQRLLSFARSDLFRDHAAALSGYDVANTGRVLFNAR